MKRLRLTEGMDADMRRYALDAALLLGFQSEAATFPVTCADTDAIPARRPGADGDTVVDVPRTDEELEALWTQKETAAPKGFCPVKKGGPLFSLDFRREKGLESMFSEGCFLHDTDRDRLLGRDVRRAGADPAGDP